MVNNFFHRFTQIIGEDEGEVFSVPLSDTYNVRQCPGCGAALFGMPDQGDARCASCEQDFLHS